ncbi:MAG TPA: hypothetical protein DDX14_06855, partial [Cyanobacteria bacterium UBA9579]|nr:hypothetical protein [Cyanobacteria bacterium UBA9579]
ILNVKEGQPVRIGGEREHEPNILKLVEYIYQTKGPVPIEVNYNERHPNNFGRTKLQYASDKVLEEVPQSMIEQFQEYLDKNTARLFLDGDDPNELEGVDPKRISKNSAAVGKALKDIRNKMIVECPWNIYYAPTTKSAISAYPEFGTDEIKALDKAADDARKINRVGKVHEHTDKLQQVANSLNDLIKNQGLDTVHFISVDPATKKPDGKTDLYIGLSEKSKFQAAKETTPSGQTYIANTPTEEAFSTPDKTKTRGVVCATMPLNLNGNLVKGIQMKFENGKAVEVKADENEEILKEHVKMHEDADMLGEVALVAGSPIFDLGRVFNNTLLDENAACHIAIGSGYSSCIEGADEIKNNEEKKAYLEKYNVNDSTTHNDFMIGGPNVVVEGITKDGKHITLIQDNKFQI